MGAGHAGREKGLPGDPVAGVRVVACRTTGMISQNNTPQALIPLLRRFDRQIWWGEYIVVVAEKM